MNLEGKRVDLTFVNGEEEIFTVISAEDATILVKDDFGSKTVIPLSSILRMDILKLFFKKNQN